MTAYNIVRFRVKPGREEDFVNLHREMTLDAGGMRRVALVDTGNGTYCVIGEWESFDDIAAARPMMIAALDRTREMLEEISPELGVTDPVSGHAVVEFGGGRKAAGRGKRASAVKKPAKRAAAKKKTPARKGTKKKAPAKKRTAKRGRR